MIAVDTNILIYAHRTESPFHSVAKPLIEELAGSGLTWAIPWPCVHEFLGIMTNSRIYKPSISLEEALARIDDLKFCPTLHFLGETDSYWNLFKETSKKSKMVGPQIHDVRVAAICLANHVKVLWSADRDFTRIDGLKVINPLIKKDVFSS